MKKLSEIKMKICYCLGNLPDKMYFLQCGGFLRGDDLAQFCFPAFFALGVISSMIESSSGYQVLSFIFFSLLCAWEHISMDHCEEQPVCE